jgi:hypothetical protein
MRRSPTQAGGITILVALMLLVFLTVVAVGMSRNSFREIVISGTSRQGSMVRNIADSGIEWGIFWLEQDNDDKAVAGTATATDTVKSLISLSGKLLKDPSLSGKPYDAANATPTLYDVANPTVPPDLKWAAAPGSAYVPGYSIALTRMGKLPITDMSQGLGPGAFSPAQGNENKQAPDLWALRSDAKLDAGLLGNTFVNSKEAWITTAVRIR